MNGQTDQDWMKPGTRADREEMVRILVEDLKADVKILDMHDYRYIEGRIAFDKNSEVERMSACIRGFGTIYGEFVVRDIVGSSTKPEIFTLFARRAALKLLNRSFPWHTRRLINMVPWSLPLYHLASLLHYACISGWERTVDFLLDHGADPRQTCMTGETALHFAVSLRHGEAAETLLKRSQDLVNEADKV